MNEEYTNTLEEEIQEQRYEIERLEIDYQQANEVLAEQSEEIERLNNIINELEKYICEIEYDNSLDTIIWTTAVLIHNKLKELKGVDKDGNE